jgi:hypothetical protein
MILRKNGKDIGNISILDLAAGTELPLPPVITIILTDPKIVAGYEEKMHGLDDETGIVEL